MRQCHLAHVKCRILLFCLKELLTELVHLDLVRNIIEIDRYSLFLQEIDAFDSDLAELFLL